MDELRGYRSIVAAVALVIALAAVPLVLGACGGSSGSSGSITMWDIPESDGYTAWWKDYIERFEKSHDGVEIDLQQFESEPYKAKIQSAIVAGTAPDIFYAIPGPQYSKAFREGKMTPLDKWVDPDRLVPSARAACTVDGELACLPLYVAPSYVYYNKKLFQEAGVDPSTWADPTQPTWEEFVAACDKLKAAGVAPLAVGNGEKWPGLFYYWAFQNRFGGTKAFQDAMSGQNGGSFAGPSFIKAGELTQEIVRRGYVQEGYNGISGDQKYAVFTQGHAAMIYMGPWMVGTIADTAPEDFDYGFFSFPSFSDGDPDSQDDIMAGVDALWMSSDTKSESDAGRFLQGFTTEKSQTSFVEESGSVSAVEGFAEQAPDSDDPIIQMAKLSETAPHAFPWWDAALPPKTGNAMLNNSQALLAGKMSPEEFGKAMDEAAGR
jgi:raffinose/stachyose/melibiose transport system substrate-binding protein